MAKLKVLVSAILAGVCIGLSGVVLLSVENKVLGAALFTVGLFTICTFGLNLYTGKICYVFFQDRDYALNLPIIWLGNLIGTGLIALCARMTRIASISERAMSMCQTKLDDSLLSLFFLGVLCNLLIYIAVAGYNRNPHELGKYLSLFLGVTIFITSGTEHCVADMFYFWMAGAWSGRTVICLLVITLGNSVGGVLFGLLHDFVKKKGIS